MMPRLAWLLVWSATLTVCLPLLAADERSAGGAGSAYWPCWRGAHRDGISPDKGLLDEWPEGGPPLVWKAEGLGRGFSSVSIADGRIFTMGDREGGQFVIALSLDDGHELWSTRLSDVWEPGGYAGPRCTPSLDGARLYALGPHGDLVCLETATGKEVWHHKMQADFGGRMHSALGLQRVAAGRRREACLHAQAARKRRSWRSTRRRDKSCGAARDAGAGRAGRRRRRLFVDRDRQRRRRAAVRAIDGTRRRGRRPTTASSCGATTASPTAPPTFPRRWSAAITCSARPATRPARPCWSCRKRPAAA